MPEFDSSKFYIGKPCKHGHLWQGGNATLRYLSDGKCVQCRLDRAKKFREQNPDLIRQRKQDYAARNREVMKQSRQLRYRANRQRILDQQKAYRLKNKEAIASRDKAYYLRNRAHVRRRHSSYYRLNRSKIILKVNDYQKTSTGKAVKLKVSCSRRAAKQQLLKNSWKASQQIQHFSQFGNVCGYCGATQKPLQADHFIALSRGGSDCLSNIVPCCQRCNLSKHAQDPKAWYESQPFYSKRKWLKILRLLGKTESTYNQIPFL